MKLRSIAPALCACVFFLALSACVTSQKGPPLQTDHHMHIRSAEMGAEIGKICGKLAACNPEELAIPVTATQAIATLDEAGLDRGVLLGLGYFAGLPELEFSISQQQRIMRAENAFVAQEVAKHPERLVGFFSINPLADYAVEEIAYWAQNSDLAGLKMHFANSGVDFSNPEHIAKLRTVFAALQRHELAALVHLRNRNPAYGKTDVEIFVNEVLATTPSVHVTIAHFGGWGGYDAATEAAMGAFIDAIAAGNVPSSQLTFGIDAVIANNISEDGKARFAAQMREVGLERVVFGSDWDGRTLTPFTPASVLEDLRSLSLTDEEVTQILTNAAPYLER